MINENEVFFAYVQLYQLYIRKNTERQKRLIRKIKLHYAFDEMPTILNLDFVNSQHIVSVLLK